MLKFAFWALLAANAVWFAASQGYLGHLSADEHEPQRLLKQIGTDKLVMLTAQQAQETLAAATVAADTPPPPAEEPAPAAPKPVLAPALVCTEVSNLREADARKFETRLAKLDLGSRQTRREVAATDFSSYIVFIPPQGSKEAAERKVAELKALDVTNFFVMNADSPMKWAVSLGVFKSEAAAQAQLAALVKQGVHSAKVAGRASGTRVTYQFRGIEAGTSARIERMAETYTGQETRACK
ncbi:SPOR domain-containing protein [Massilia sp. S19_KUP03_FR1]|uniref:SPOR domain-containing protein n=1 Tax=Massilia sp. S19_KUP03_FR1 TaxID=3025503 RepID=UPI002FCCBF75